MKESFEFRSVYGYLHMPLYSEEHKRNFYDKNRWESFLTQRAKEGVNAIIYWVDPWLEHQWQTFLIRHEEFPEAREIEPKEQEQIIEQAKWIFRKAKELGMKNIMFNHCIITTRAFAKAHGMVEAPFASWERGPHWGYRNELTRAFTEAAIAELFRIYEDMNGLLSDMGEVLPGKRSTWFKEAIVPGLKRSGRNPIFMVHSWMLPLEDFLADIAPKEVYDNTWVVIMPNGEMFSDPKPYPIMVRWAEQGGVPVVMHPHFHNFEGNFPCNSPKLAYEMVKEYKKIDNCIGIHAEISEENHLLRKALAHYSMNLIESYSDEPWITILEEKQLIGRGDEQVTGCGDKEAAKHFLKAYDVSARIIPELCALVWHPTDGVQGRSLNFRYWLLSEDFPGQISGSGWYTVTSRGETLLPLRRYTKIIAQYGDKYRNNNGSDYAKNTHDPPIQQLIWGLSDYPVTPEAHVRKIRMLGEEALKEAEAAMKTVKKNMDQATRVYNYMKAYKLLADYFERKILAAIPALIYSFNSQAKYREEAERLGDEVVELYVKAANFIWESIDHKSGNIKARWAGKSFNMLELIEEERKEREQMPKIFKWPGN